MPNPMAKIGEYRTLGFKLTRNQTAPPLAPYELLCYHRQMRVYLFILVFLGVLVNVPLPCAHALGAPDPVSNTLVSNTLDQDIDAPRMTHDMHAAMGHEMPAGDAPETPETSHSQHHGCKTNCAGGVSCDGCVSVTASLCQSQLDFASVAIPAKQDLYFEPLGAIANALEPPPPRRFA